jgi:hypothetical protein
MTANGSTFDFEEFWREWQANDPDSSTTESSPKRITIDGREYALPDTLPAIVVLRRMRQGRRSLEQIFEAGDALYGEGIVEEWARAGMDVEKIVAAISAAEALVSGTPPEELYQRARNGLAPTEKKSIST